MEGWGVMLACLLGMAIIWSVKILSNSVRWQVRARGSAKSRAQAHFVKAAELLALAKAGARGRGGGEKGSSSRNSGCRQALKEADLALELDPRDAASHIVKGLALEHLGQHTAALRCLNTALSPPAVRTLSVAEKADTLAKRAAMLLDQRKGHKSLQAATSDLVESASLQPGNEKVWCALAGCYERQGKGLEASEAYHKALLINPNLPDAIAAIQTLRTRIAPASRRSS